MTALLLTSTTVAFAIQETEPNNTCALAQNIALSPSVTSTINGALKTPPSVPDVDFYKFSGTAGDLLRVTLSGVSDGADTLTLPLAEALNSSCQTTYNSGSYDPITFQVVVPTDGIVIVAVSSCCDFSLTGTGFYAGSYTLAVTEVVPVQSISGRAVDSVTGQPIPNVYAQLALCGDPACATVTQGEGLAYTDSLGQFSFPNSSFTATLPPGTYQVTLEDFGGRYETTTSPPFAAAGGQQVVIPDVLMQPVPVISSLSGRIVDSVTHAPLSGVSAPFANIQLFGCSGFSCSFLSGSPDSTGRFVFTHDGSGRGILASTSFSMFVGAEQYQALFSSIFTLGAGANQDLGDILLVSNPIRFGVVQGCSNVPLAGGLCQYKVEITNGIATPVQGAAWATMSANNLGSFVGSSTFQTGEPQDMYLAGATATTRSTRTATFQFWIPGTVPNYAFICPTFWFGTGDDSNPQLHTQGVLNDYTDCVQRTATGYTPATPEQVERLRKEHHEHEAKERAAVLPK